jgi:hypothetical protein
MRPYSKGQKNHARRIIENDSTPIVGGAWPTSQSPGDARCSSWLAKRYRKILEIPVEAPRSRSGRRPQRAQNVCTQSVVASIYDCEWGIAPPRRCNQIRSWLLRPWMRLSFDYLKIKGRSSFEWLSLKRLHTYDRNVRKLGVAAKVFSYSALRAKMSTATTGSSLCRSKAATSLLWRTIEVARFHSKGGAQWCWTWRSG